MAVEVLVGPAEPLRVEPVVVGHRRDGGCEPRPAGVVRGRGALGRASRGRGGPASSFQASIPSAAAAAPAAGPADARRAPRPPRRTRRRGGRRGRRPSSPASPRRRSRRRPGAPARSSSKWAKTAASSAQKRSFAAGEVRRRRLRIRPERVVLDLARAEAVGPRLEDPEVVDRVAVEDAVDPAPCGVAVDRRERQRRARRRASAACAAVEPRPQLGRRDVGEQRPAALVERVEVAAVVVVVGRPAARRERRRRRRRRRARTSRRHGRRGRAATSPGRRHPTERRPAAATRRRRARPTTR